MAAENKEYDVIVLGAGPAGLTAGIYAARYGLKVAVLSKEVGGMMNYAEIIENYPGFAGSGIELAQKFAGQAREFGAEILQEEIVDVSKNQAGKFEIKTSKNKILTGKSVIFAFGTEKRKLNIEGEENLLGKGVSYCATCDAPLFRKRKVAVVGGRNSAAHAALLLARYSDIVYIVYRKEKLNCDGFLAGEIEKHKNIKMVLNAVPLKIEGKEKVEKFVVDVGGNKRELHVDGVFIEIGSVPASSIAARLGIKVNDEGYIIADDCMMSNVKGVFVAGDVIQNSLKQIVTAAASGAVAANSAYNFLKRR